jgi:hypothetical protein
MLASAVLRPTGRTLTEPRRSGAGRRRSNTR